MENEPMKQLFRLSNATNKDYLYLDLAGVTAIDTWRPGDNTYPIPPDTTNTPPCTRLVFANGYGCFVRESIAEIIALVEGRDPAPAKVLFGAKGA